MAPDADTEAQRELELLRARVAALEHELSERTAEAHAAVVAAQERSYWLDRWHLDLNGLMRRRGAAELRAAFRAARVLYRLLIHARDRVRRTTRSAPGAARGLREAIAEERSLAAKHGSAGNADPPS